jgi:hypothetical protein
LLRNHGLRESVIRRILESGVKVKWAFPDQKWPWWDISEVSGTR